MKSRGFTLIELLAVIVLLAIIFILVYPTILNILSESRDTVYQKQINTILNAAYDFSLKDTTYLPDANEKNYITLGQLRYEGLIDINIKDPNTNNVFPDNLVVSINNVGAGYKYSNKNSKLEGDYLYTVEIENLNNSDLMDLMPKIILNGIEPNSDGNYIKLLNLDEPFNEVSYKATSHNGIDLTDRVKKNILLNEKAVDSVDSSSAGIYKINYSVVDDNGYATILVYNIIIADDTPPTITVPEETIISKDTTYFDLSKDVDCEDNSGFCYIEFSGEIEYGVIDKYIITYTVKDPSGNTATKKRVITIE